MKRSLPVFLLFCMIFFICCARKETGFITLVNSDIETSKIYIDGRSFKINPAHHITKEVPIGEHSIHVGNEPSIKVKVGKGLATVFDSTGLSCFVVADFTHRAEEKGIQIIEKSYHTKVFTTKLPMITVLGSPFPKKTDNKPLLRLHQIDCEMINEDDELINGLKDLP